MTRAARIVAAGSALPERVVPNEWFSQFVDTSDEWIRSRTGIAERRFAAEGETASTLAAAAVERALASAGLEPESVDLTLVATVTGDRPFPSTAAYVQRRVGLRGGAFDLAAGCAGFVYALSVGSALVSGGQAETVVIAGAEVLSRLMDLTDRGTCVLFGDGAGAVVLQPSDEPGVIDSLLENDATQTELLRLPAGGSAMPTTSETIAAGENFIKMPDGKEVFRRAVIGMADVCGRLLDKAGVPPEEVTLVVPHQANARIIKAVADRLKFPPERVFVDVEKVGNTSAASIPVALDHAWRGGRLSPGDLVLTTAFGAGLAYGANLIRWTAESPGA
ncbi:MAG TPA: beta-ketoacyl-ACP synthase III [Actinomycetota bacterium]|nr:beta-ketoacyl-ACP synthase III [Actinomycetota bacterium]